MATKTQTTKTEKSTQKVAKKVAPKKTTNPESNEFAVILTGGKQYKVKDGDIFKIEKLNKKEGGEYKEGDKITFDDVLLYANNDQVEVGMPKLEKKSVEALFVKSDRSKKVIVIKYKSKSRYFKKNGHRQPYSTIKISAIK